MIDEGENVVVGAVSRPRRDGRPGGLGVGEFLDMIVP